jgi:formylglycine-generating enzyme required for sulfatase activity
MTQGKKMSGQIFISYRREETRWSARILHDRLCRAFDPKQIFMDIDAIALGEDFVEVIETKVAKCDVLIAVIGKNWLTSKDDQGHRRLDNPEDFVRMEVGAALKRKIRVIPVLVDGALIPRSTELPEDLKPLVRRNALLITDTSFEADCERLATAVRQVLEKVAAEQREREEEGRLKAKRAETEAKERVEWKRQLSLERATRENPWVNSLGMKFVPVAGTHVLFSIWDTRVQDFEAFVKSTGYDATEGMWSLGKDGWQERVIVTIKPYAQRMVCWKEPGFEQGPTHPVVGVSWDDAKAFCKWLTERERSARILPEDRVYRLPTDGEWSVSVGLHSEPGNTPKEKDSKIKLYPWGKEWPPGAGNYAGEESKTGKEPSDWLVIEGYNDGYPRTSPVGSFAANEYGLYNMGGNVWQWCEDWYDATRQNCVLRGASWGDTDPDLLLASCRFDYPSDYRIENIGFRCVVGFESSLPLSDKAAPFADE